MLKDKIVVITGASSGIGAEIAMLAAKQGGIPILMARSLDKLQQVAEKIDGEHAVYQLDVGKTDQVNTVIKEVIHRYKRIDVLINNAGYGVFDYVVDATIEDLEAMMNVNYLGMVRCIKAVLPSMLVQQSGQIINIASVAGKIATAKSVGYSATKFAMIGFTNGLRHELKGTGIYASTVNPGPIDTPFFDKADPEGTYVENVKWLMLTPEKVANKVMKVMIHKKREITIPFMASVGTKLFSIFPKTFDRLMGNKLNKK